MLDFVPMFHKDHKFMEHKFMNFCNCKQNRLAHFEFCIITSLSIDI